MSVSNTTKRVKDIRRNTRRKFSSEEKIRIVLDGLRGESSIAELCRREGINMDEQPTIQLKILSVSFIGKGLRDNAMPGIRYLGQSQYHH